MASLRRLPSWALARPWPRLVCGRRVRHRPGLAPAGFLVASWPHSSLRPTAATSMIIKYPVIPWLAMMMLGWVFGRYLIQFATGERRFADRILLIRGTCGLVVFAIVRYAGRLRRHVPASRRRLVAAVAARQQVPAIVHLHRAGAWPAVGVLAGLMTFERAYWVQAERHLAGVRPDRDVLLPGTSAGVRDSGDVLRSARRRRFVATYTWRRLRSCPSIQPVAGIARSRRRIPLQS